VGADGQRQRHVEVAATLRPEKRPAYDPSANPVRIKCSGNHVFGWVYPDGTLELICTEKICRRSRDEETRHLVNPENGLSFPIYVPKPQKP
jgi:hypothetical protein